MADPQGFLAIDRVDAPKRPVDERVRDWREIYAEQPVAVRNAEVSTQARRCMDCGIPFCHSVSAGCPLGNLIPEWNDLVRRGRWSQAAARLHATNNFPEFTGRVCPAPCEAGCVLSLAEIDTGGSVTIKRIEQTIADSAWERGDVAPVHAAISTGHRVAVVGSGPAGLAAAQQLTRAGHDVTVYERDDRIGGLLRYGIPAFKMDKSVLDRRLAQMRAEGTSFVVNCNVGVDIPVDRLRVEFDAVILATGALRAREDHSIEGRDLDGVQLAMPYLVMANRECEGDSPTGLTARGKHVVIIGGGDTGADCLGTAHRQGAATVTQLDYNPEPPSERDHGVAPWPAWPLILRTSPAHSEGGTRRYQVAVRRFVGDVDHHVRAMVLSEVRVERSAEGVRTVTPIGEEVELPCDLALFAIGFDGTDTGPLLDDYALTVTSRGVVSCGPDWQTTTPGVFVCGDAHRGASLVVWAIAEGRSVAAAVDLHLTGATDLPAPVHPTSLPLTVL